ncbi:ABC transporter substrate-binding protein [Chitinasiproducens palmae]|uniref:Iron complex transport system substrate-binding protein n=1 Tax=Chitinasiproducens palmae TaxID=1770053 RepID=A0A1H2PII1_9BURK|nr:ABC transporter substrate-binding protein [Chitinasiproducens palmae]SDV46046.1 iron complex transport system substrate-binding protein [Chitinasiproducens palmae]
MRRRTFCITALTWAALGAMDARAAAPSRAPLRILAPDRAATSSLLALGVAPVAGVDRAFYKSMGAEPPMPDDVHVIDSGDPLEPNLELMIELGINHCVTATTPSIACERMAVVAPVTQLDIYTGETGALARAADGLRTLGRLTGREARAEQYIAGVEAHIAATTAALRASARPAHRAAFLVTLNDGGRSMVAYGRNSIVHDVMTRVGLRNAWRRDTNEYGFAVGGVELLADAPDADIVVVDFGASTSVALDQLNASPFWNRLPMVRAGRVFRIPLVDLYSSYPCASSMLRGIDGLLRQEAFRRV